MLLPPHVAHDQQQDQVGEDWCLLLEADRALPAELMHSMMIPLHDAMIMSDLERLVGPHLDYSPLDQVWLNHAATALVINLLRNAARRPQEQRSSKSMPEIYAEKAYVYIHTNAQEIEHLEEVAESLAVSYSYLRHVFKKRYGISLATWLMCVRIERAKELLCSSALSQKAIAQACGFTSEQHFCRRFKEETGETPGAFRKAKA